MTKLEEVATALRLYVRDNDAALALEAARAAIEAMREPTEEQMRVFRHYFGFSPFAKGGGPADRLFAEAYKASFDAALSPKGE